LGFVNRATTVRIAEGNVTVDYGVSQTFTAEASDADGDQLMYSWYVDNEIQVGHTNFTFMISKTPDEETDYNIAVEVSDGEKKSTASVLLTVRDPVDATAPTVAGAWASLAPTIDGIIASDEWTDASRDETVWSYSLPDWNVDESHDVVCYVMNDATYLYIALTISVDDYSADLDDSIKILFDNDGDATSVLEKEHGDDVIGLSAAGVILDGYYDSSQDQIGWYAFRDTQDGGTVDVEGAASHTNPVGGGVGDYVFEIRHPLNGTDSTHDINLVAGDTINFSITFFDWLPNGGNIQPHYPNGGLAQVSIWPL